MIIALWPFIVLIAGILLWALSNNAKLADAGRLMFFVGLLWTVYTLAGRTLTLG